jgi:hypothetical protein
VSYGTSLPGWKLPTAREPDDDEMEPGTTAGPIPGTGTTEPRRLPELVPGTGSREPGTGPGEPDRSPGLVPGTGEPEPAPTPGTASAEPGTGTRKLPVGPVPRERISLAEDLWLEFRRWFRRAMAEQEKHGGIGHWALTWISEGQPESPRQVSAHADSRQWLQPYMTGWVRWAAEWENVLYLRFIGIPVVAVLNKLSDIFARQSRLAVAVLIGVIALLIYMAHH